MQQTEVSCHGCGVGGCLQAKSVSRCKSYQQRPRVDQTRGSKICDSFVRHRAAGTSLATSRADLKISGKKNGVILQRKQHMVPRFDKSSRAASTFPSTTSNVI